MVLEVVLLEGDGHGQSDGQVAEVAKVSIGAGSGVSKGEAVRDLVHSQGQGVINNTPEAVGGDDNDRPGLVLQQGHHQDLTEHHARGNPFKIGIVAEKVFNLWILL